MMPSFNKQMTIKKKKNILFSRFNQARRSYEYTYQQTTGYLHVFRIVWSYDLRRVFHSAHGHQSRSLGCFSIARY